MGLNREEKRKQRKKREKRTEVPSQWREKFRGWNKIYIYIYIYIFFFLEYCYSTILTLELYCSTIAKKFAIMGLPFFDAHVFKP